MFDIANNPEFLEAIGIANAPEETKAKLIAGIENLAQKKLVVKISDKITDEQAEEFGNITDENQAKSWLETNVPDFPSLATEVFEEIKNDILAHKANVVGV